jgi:hypothetical protein
MSIQTGLQSKVLLALGLSSALVIGAIFAGMTFVLLEIQRSGDAYGGGLRGAIQDLQQEFQKLEEEFVALPQKFESDPTGAIVEWAQTQHGATVVDHNGRDAVVDRYKKRRARRDLQKPARFVVDETSDGVSISFGLMNESGEFSGNVRELKLKTADAAAVASAVEGLSAGADDPDFLGRRVNRHSPDNSQTQNRW